MTTRSNQLRAWAYRSQSARHMNVIAKHAAPYLQVAASSFDAKPFLLNVRNGTIGIGRTMEGSPHVTLKPHDSRDFITKVCDVHYDPDAGCPNYDEALAHVQPDPEVRSFLHRMMGYAATGDVSEQKLFFFYGEGRNGKSTFVDVWSHVLGSYAATVPIETFLDAGRSHSGGQPTPHLARLAGVQFLRASEPERGSVLAEALIKLATSGEPMLVRELNRSFFELRPQFKLVMSGNHRPQIRGTDEGIWRRICLVPWQVKISDEDCDPNLPEKLRAEASGILNRMLGGVCDWKANGLAIPSSIQEATSDFRTSTDHLGRFVEDCIRRAPGERISSQDVYDTFTAWAQSNGAPVWKRTGFGRAMTDRGFKSTKSGNNYWLDVALTELGRDFKPQNPHAKNESPSSMDDEVPF